MKKTVDWTKTYSLIDIKKAHHAKPLYVEYFSKRSEIISRSPVQDFSKWDGMTEAAMTYRQAYNNAWTVIQKELEVLNKEYWPKMVETFNIKPPLTHTEKADLEQAQNERREKKLQKKLAKEQEKTAQDLILVSELSKATTDNVEPS